jgi:hypothetical protein
LFLFEELGLALLRFRLEGRIPLQHPDARVTPQDRVVVSGRPQRLGFGKMPQRFVEPLVDAMGRGARAVEVRLGAALGDETAEVAALVLAAKLRRDPPAN